MRSLAITLSLSVAAATALAQEPSRGEPSGQPDTAQAGRKAPTVVESVWRVTADNGVEHLQSGLACPATAAEQRRSLTFVGDDYGLEAGCNYSGRGVVMTVSAAPAAGETFDEVMVGARKELVTGATTQQPVLLANERITDAGLNWTMERYDLDGGRISEIWLAETSGWRVRYRVTYSTPTEGGARALIKVMTANVAATAVPRFALCARAEPVARKGKRITDRKSIEGDAMMAGLLGGALAAGAKDKKADAGPPAPLVWCAERGIESDGFKMIFWRSVQPDGKDGGSDRVTLATRAAPPTLSIASDPLAALIKKDVEPRRWMASMLKDQQVLIYGGFDGRPTAEDAAALFAEVLSGKTRAAGGYSVDGKSITIITPPK